MQPKFIDVLETVEALPADEKEMLVEIVSNRIGEERREQILREIESSRTEFENGECEVKTADEIMEEVLS